MREKLFILYYEIKYQSCYLTKYRILPIIIDRTISGIALISGAACIAAWPLWGSIESVWCVIVGLSQLIQALRPVYPWSKQMSSISDSAPKIQKLLHGLLMAWSKYGERDNFSEEKCSKLFDQFSSKYNDIKDRYKLDDIPTVGVIEKRSKRDCEMFFAMYHGISDWRNIHVEESTATATTAPTSTTTD